MNIENSTQNVQQNQLVMSRTFAVTSLNMSFVDETWRRFGRTFQSKREQARMTQEDVADKAAIHVKTVSRIENGASTKRETVSELAKVVNWDTNEALELAGFASVPAPGETFKIGDAATVKLSDNNLTADEQREIADELSLAYEVIMLRRQHRLKQQ